MCVLGHDQSSLTRIVNLPTMSNAQDADGASGGIFAVGVTSKSTSPKILGILDVVLRDEIDLHIVWCNFDPD